MKALAILGAMVSAWIAWVGITSLRPAAFGGGVIFLLLAGLFGIAALWL